MFYETQCVVDSVAHRHKLVYVWETLLMAVTSFSRIMHPATLHVIQEGFHEQDGVFKVFAWPPNSQDLLNVIEHLWDVLDQQG